MVSHNPQELTWALVIATYNRRHILPRCLRLALQQTRLPAEVVVVDASPDWEALRAEIMREVAEDRTSARPEGRHPIKWRYVEAERRSSAFQRNQGVRLATADVLFLIDDDSLMYPDCAEAILRIYEADPDGVVAGVNAMHVPLPPDHPDDPEALHPSIHGTTRQYGPTARMVRRILRAEDLFVPYDAEFPRHPLPPALRRPEIGTRELMAGWGMTFRRSICEREPFDEIMTRYAAGEDSDMGYRASRHGLLLTALNGRLCHLGASGGRLNPFVVAALGNMNPLVLHRIYSTDLERSMRLSRRLLARRMLILLGKDLMQRNFTLPNARGILFARQRMKEIFSKGPAELRAWYPEFQLRLIEQYS